MPTSPSCLPGLIGLSRAASPCFPLPTGVDTAYITASASGLYLDEVEGLTLRPAPLQTPGTDAWQRFDKARSQAESVVENYLSTRMVLGSPVRLLQGTLGGMGNGMLLPVGTPAVLTLPVQRRTGLGWQLHGIRLMTSATVTVPLYLDDVLIGQLTTNGGPFDLPTNNDPILLPFDGQEHTLRAELPAGVQVRQNVLTCGCANEWVRGVSTVLQPGTSTKMPAMGFILQVEEVCIAGKPLCFAIEQDAELKQSVAFAVLYKTAELLTISLLSDANYSRYTSLDQKALQALAEHFYLVNHKPATAEDAGHLTWLTGTSGLARVPHPCYSCAPGPMAYTKRR